jgi:hypothetical protein
LIVVLLAIGFAIGFPLGREAGFMTGSEWAIVQAEIVAREAGMSMPVTLEEGQLHVVVKQPQDLYRRAQQRAALAFAGVQIVRSERGEQREGPAKDN